MSAYAKTNTRRAGGEILRPFLLRQFVRRAHILDFTVSVRIMRTMKSADLIREIIAAGWELDRVRGSHHVFVHPHRPGHLVVPHPKKDLGKRLVTAIRKQAGLRS